MSAVPSSTRSAQRRVSRSVSGSGATNEGDGPLLRYIGKPIGNLFLKHQFADFRAMESVVRSSGLDWTILRPPRLTDRPGTGKYQIRRELNVRGSAFISRADLARAILALCDDRDTYQAAFGVAR